MDNLISESISDLSLAPAIGLWDLVLSLSTSAVLCIFLAVTYIRSHSGHSYSRSFVHTLVFVGIAPPDSSWPAPDYTFPAARPLASTCNAVSRLYLRFFFLTPSAENFGLASSSALATSTRTVIAFMSISSSG